MQQSALADIMSETHALALQALEVDESLSEERRMLRLRHMQIVGARSLGSAGLHRSANDLRQRGLGPPLGLA